MISEKRKLIFENRFFGLYSGATPTENAKFV